MPNNTTYLVRLQPSGQEVEGLRGQSLLTILREAEVPIGSSCGGKLVCGHCCVAVLSGEGALSPVCDEEANLLAKKACASNQRMACSAYLLGSVTIQAGYW